MRTYKIFVHVKNSTAEEVTRTLTNKFHARTCHDGTLLISDERRENRDAAEIEIDCALGWVFVLAYLPYGDSWEEWRDLIWRTLTNELHHAMDIEVQDNHDNIIYEAERPAVSAEKSVA